MNPPPPSILASANSQIVGQTHDANCNQLSAPARSSRRPRAIAIAALLLFALSIIAQLSANAQTTPIAAADSANYLLSLPRTISLSADYLERSCDANGKFAYLVDINSEGVLPSYNIVRHAGAIYALAMLNRVHPDPNAVNAMVRAANFIRTNYIAPDTRSNALAVWSRPLPMNTEAELGAAGLGLVALAEVEHAQPNTVPLAQLQALGRFILFLQKPDGSFYSKYRADTGLVRDWQSLYYPGEAALGLISLYELDHSRAWLIAAGRALSYLARRRTSPQEPPPDHWALIATGKLLPYYDRSACLASRAELLQHATRICNRFLSEQMTNAPDTRLNGGFDPSGRTTPTAIRLEGLLAALEFLPNNNGELRARIKTAVQRGVAFLMNAQIASGPYAGGMPGAVLSRGSEMASNARSASKIRIDYVQHSLCAWLRYQELYRGGIAHATR
jgi:hypothetical protein